MSTVVNSVTGKNQEDFRLKVKTILLQRRMTVKDLAKLITRPRTTVARTIHGGNFPRVRKEILAALKLS